MREIPCQATRRVWYAEAQALANPLPRSNVNNGVVSTALAVFADELMLTGDLYGSGYLLVAVGGT